ncbi:hypothetical protein C3E97_004510 [Pseudomonas sp. MWU12-2115]|uniref:hypothetical protein n=1 Tax=unclassified Pseudomonas TaxID=196821 RepID=UPI000CD54E80|nr:hypothetical protein [Pseudomonas sp. MWU12-2020]RBC03299.1 hypothetical protein C3E97_004510 [Pseudomonas sp. MWU12-2115]
MSYPKIAKLVETLAVQTESGSLQWAQTEKSDMFQASFPRYSIRLYPKTASTFEVDYVLQILNDLGDIVEEVSDPDLRSVLENPFNKMRDLYEGARRSAMGVESALDDILFFLDPKF